MESNELKFAGATRIATWAHFNESDIKKQIGYLKGVGVNLLRVHLDLYCWAAMKTKFLQRVKRFARIAQDNKIYIQWVMFDADTPGDVSGVDQSSRSHEIGGLDPSSLSGAMVSGLQRYQRCPTVYASSLITRAPSSMTVSGNSYFEDVVRTVSSFQSTLAWEAMANVDFNAAKNPADISGYAFVTSAVNKLRSIVPSTQKITASFKYLTGDRGTLVPNPRFSVDKIKICELLDFICYNAEEAVGPFKKHFNYLQALRAASLVNKMLLVVNAGDWGSLNSLESDIYDFSGFGIGFVADAMIDRNTSCKPKNNTKGIFFQDGSVRNSLDTNYLLGKSRDDLKLTRQSNRKLYDKYFINAIVPKDLALATDVSGLQFASYVSSTFTRFSQFGLGGSAQWSATRTDYLNKPENKSINYFENVFYGVPSFNFINIGTNFSPFEWWDRSKSAGHGVASEILKLSYLELTNNPTSLAAALAGMYSYPPTILLPDLVGTTLAITLVLGDTYKNLLAASNPSYARFVVSAMNSSIPGYGDFFRNRLSYFKINLLEKLQEALPIPEISVYSETTDFPRIISQARINSILDTYRPFAPSSASFKPSVSAITPYMASPLYVSSISPYDASTHNKPLCYYNRGVGYASGACYYKAGVTVDPNVTSVQNVLDKLDWDAYDLKISQWYYEIIQGYVEVIANFPTYLEYFKSKKAELFNKSVNRADVYFVAGDSIAFGSDGNGPDLSGYSKYKDTLDGMEDCFIFRGVQANETSSIFGPFTAPRFETIYPGKNTQSPFSDSIPNNNMGAEVPMIKNLKDTYKNSEIYLVKIGIGGTVGVSSAGSIFSPDAWDWSPSSTGEMFSLMQSYVGSALDLLVSAGKYPIFRGGYICLGTNPPAGFSSLPYYFNQANINQEVSAIGRGLVNLFTSSSKIISDGNETVVWMVPIIGDAYGYFERYRVAVSALTTNDTRFVYYDPPWGRPPDPTPPNEYLADGVHYKTKGFIKIGEHFANVISTRRGDQ
jgi:hypothetical protein